MAILNPGESTAIIISGLFWALGVCRGTPCQDNEGIATLSPLLLQFVAGAEAAECGLSQNNPSGVEHRDMMGEKTAALAFF